MSLGCNSDKVSSTIPYSTHKRCLLFSCLSATPHLLFEITHCSRVSPQHEQSSQRWLSLNWTLKRWLYSAHATKGIPEITLEQTFLFLWNYIIFFRCKHDVLTTFIWKLILNFRPRHLVASISALTWSRSDISLFKTLLPFHCNLPYPFCCTVLQWAWCFAECISEPTRLCLC